MMKLKVIGNPVEATKVLNSQVEMGQVLECAPGSAMHELVDGYPHLFVVLTPKDMRPRHNKMLTKTALTKAK